MEHSIQGYSQVTILEYVNKTPILFFPQAFFTSIDMKGESRIGSGGQQGLDLIGWNTENNGTFLIHTPMFTMKLLEVIAGTKVKEINESFMEVEVSEIDNNTITLLNTPFRADLMQIYQLDSTGKFISNSIAIGSVDDTVVTLNGNYDGWALVTYYIQEEIDLLEIGKFNDEGYYTIIGSLEMYNKLTTITETLRFEFPKVIINNSFDIKTLNNRNPDEVFTLNCQALIEDKMNKSLLRIIKRK